MSFVSELIATFGLILLIYWCFFKDNKSRKFYQKFPAPPGVFLLGNALVFKNSEIILPVFQKYTESLGNVVRFNIGPFKKILIISDYKFIEFILSNSKVINKSINYLFFIPWLGNGLLTSKGQKWKNHRRIITPAFHFQILEQFLNIFEAGGNVFVKKLGKEVGKLSINIYPLVTLCTLDIICESAMGTTVNAQEYEDSEYVRSVKDMCQIIVERSLSVIGANDFLYSFTKNYQKQKHALKILHNYTDSVIKARREELKKMENFQQNNNDFGIKKKMAFLDLLLQSTVDGQPLTQKQIREEVDTFMFEGHDTTASAISFALFSLANNPEVQKKAFEEQKLIFNNTKDPQVTYQNFQDMKYLEFVIKETLRLYPSVPLYSRRTDQELEFEGTKIPTGIHLTIFAYGIQRNPKYFPDPDKFNPDRFENIDGRLPYAYVPFSAGPRNCIGQKFAMLEMKSTISKVIRNFELLPASPHHHLRLVAETVLKSANGINIALKTRQY